MKFFRLLKNEYLRLFHNRRIMLILFALLFSNMVLFYVHAGNDKIDYSIYKELKEKLSAMPYEEGAGWLYEQYENESDSPEFKQLIEEYNTAYFYSEYLQKIQDEAEDNSKISIFSNSSFAIKNLAMTAEDFKKLEGIKIKSIGGYGFSMALSFQGTGIILIMVVALLIMAILLEDNKTGMLAMLRATRYGGKHFATVKIIVVASISSLSAILMRGLNLLVAWNLYGKVPLDASIQSLYGYDKCDFVWTVMKGILFHFLITCLVFSFVGLLMFLIATFTNNYVLYYVLIAGVFLVEYTLYFLGRHVGALGVLKRFNLISFIDTKSFFEYYNYNFFGHPMRLQGVHIIGLLVLMTVLIILGILGFAGRSYEYRTITLKGKGKRWKAGFGLWKTENYKLFIGNRVLFVLLVLVLLQGYIYKDKAVRWNTAEIYYKYYISQIEGEVTEEKLAMIETEKERLEQVEREYSNYMDLFYSGEIAEAQMNSYVQNLLPELDKIDGFFMAYQYVLYIKELRDDNKGFVYERGWNYLAGSGNYKTDVSNGILFMLCLILSLAGVMAQENRYQMERLIDASYKRKKSMLLKLFSTFLIVGASYLIVYLPELFWAAKKYEIHGSEFSVYSLPQMKNINLQCSIFTYFALVYLIRFMTALIVGMAIVYLGKLTKNANITIILAMILILLPLLLRAVGVGVVDNFSLNKFVSGNMLFF